MNFPSIIQTTDLLKLDLENVVLVDAGSGKPAYENYLQTHLEGALYVDLNEDLAALPNDATQGGRHPLPSLEKFSTVLQKLGIAKDSHVIIYDHKFGANAAARFWWMLKSAGIEKVQVLDGGIQEAQKQGFPLTSRISAAKTVKRLPIEQWKWPTADIDEVEKASNNPLNSVIDVREEERYNGENEPIDLIAGHIPGAVNLPFKNNLNDDGTFKTPQLLKKQFLKITGKTNSENVIIHCGSGVTACHTILAMDYAGLETPKLYVGSWSEWSRNNKKSRKIFKSLMKKPSYITKEALKTFIKNALLEDIQDGDHSTLATIPEKLEQKAKLLVKEDCILAGVELAEIIFQHFDKNLKVEVFLKDGTPAKAGDIAFYVSGSARSILSTERLVLNCMQRMSGIATLTHDWDSRLLGTKTKLLDTRKTTPNFRLCEKWAVAIGGGTNHRFGLYDMIMLKDNHVDYNGSITNAVKMAKDYIKASKKKLKIEVETRDLQEVEEALIAGADRIMLDNMDIQTMHKAVQLINGKCESEASGGITRAMLKNVARTGVDFISAGALTHSAANIDLSLKAVK